MKNKFTRNEKRIIMHANPTANTVVVKVINGRWVITSTKHPTPKIRVINIHK